LQLATKNNASLEILKVLYHPSIVTENDEDLKTCLHYAAEKGMSKEVLKLLHSPEILDWRDTNARTCLHLALAKGRIVDKERLQYFVPVVSNNDDETETTREDILTARDQDGASCLHYAVANGALSFKVLQWLMPNDKSCDILNWRDKHRNTCLHLAAQNVESIECLKLLMPPKNPDKILRLANKTGQTPLHYVCSNVHATYKMLELLLLEDDKQQQDDEDDKEPPDEKNEEEESAKKKKKKKNAKKSILTWTDKQELAPLHHACSNPSLCHSLDVLKLLLPLWNKHDCDEILLGNGYRCRNCLFLVAEQGELSLEALKLLLPRYKKHRRDVLLSIDYEGTRCLDLVVERSTTDLERIVTYLWEHELFHWRELPPYSQKRIAKAAVTSKSLQNCIIVDLSKRTTTSLIVGECYRQIAWLVLYGIVLEQYYITKVNERLVVMLYVLTGIMAMSELLHLIYRRFWGYLFNWTNLLQLIKLPLVIVSGVYLQATDYDDADVGLDVLLAINGVVMIVSFILFLGKTFGPMGIFVQGILSISVRLIPFWIIGALILYAFSILYFIQSTSTSSSAITLPQSIATSLFYIFQGPSDDESTWLDALFGVVVLLFLVSFLIAIVAANLKQDEKLQSSFWLSRMTHLASVELFFYWVLCGCCCSSNSDIDGRPPEEDEKKKKPNNNKRTAAVFQYLSQSLAYYEELSIRDVVDWRTVSGITSGRDYYEQCKQYYSLERHYYWAFKRTIPANLGCIRKDQEVEELETNDFPYVCFEVTLQAVVYMFLLLIGFFTAGLLWPRRVRKALFEIIADDDSTANDKIMRETSNTSSASSGALTLTDLEQKVDHILEQIKDRPSNNNSGGSVPEDMKEMLAAVDQKLNFIVKDRMEQRMARVKRSLGSKSNGTVNN